MSTKLLAALAAVVLSSGGAPRAMQADDDARLRVLLLRIEQIVQSGDPAAYEQVLADTADPVAAGAFAAQELQPGATRVVLKERDRQPLPGTLPGSGYSLSVDLLIESGDRARIATWQLGVKTTGTGEWRVAGQERLASVENLYRLSVNPGKQFTARNLKITAEDFDLTLADGSVFAIETDRGVTGLVLLGQGDMTFTPKAETEQSQVRIFAGATTLASRFDAAYLRLGRLEAHMDPSQLVPRSVDPRELRRAQDIFREESGKSYSVDLADLTQDSWSLLPEYGNFLAEVRTRRFDTLTYTRAPSEAEDISLFDRRRRKTIATYASPQKLATRGRFYNEDDLAAYDVLEYDIDIAYTPSRQWIEGRADLRLRPKSLLGQITLRLAEPLVVHAVVSAQYGRLFSLRVKNQDMVLVNLPLGLMSDSELDLSISYSGALESQAPDRETLMLEEQGQPASGAQGMDMPVAEPSFLYSNRSYWYPQAPITDYATATLRISVPAGFDCVATGEWLEEPPTPVSARESAPRKGYLFAVDQPVRYLSFLVSRFTRGDRIDVIFDDQLAAGSDPMPAAEAPAAAVYDSLGIIVRANPQQAHIGRDLAPRAVDVARFYRSIIGDSPYPTFTLALIEGLLPGGHSPPYFASLNHPLPNTQLTWRNDPATFNGFPEFFLAHEVAHQWWGHAVGWRNYHEQWLSEGFAQYFAALYAEHSRGDRAFTSVMRQLRRWGIDESAQGPVYLGYRLGHLRNESRVFRALVYNKGAAVLHMLRRLIGDDAFFRGIRRFYAESRFRKAGTDQLRTAMETESGRSLERFFERWIYNATLPRLKFSYRLEPSAAGQDAVLRVEQEGDLFDVPVTVILQYATSRVSVVVPVTERTNELRVPLEGPLRGIDVSRDDGTLAEVVKTQ